MLLKIAGDWANAREPRTGRSWLGEGAVCRTGLSGAGGQLIELISRAARILINEQFVAEINSEC